MRRIESISALTRGVDHSARILRSSLRAVLATPIVSIVAMLSLAVGIGASTAIFSLVDGLLIRALPVSQPGRLVIVSTGATSNAFTYAVFDDIRQRRLFDGGLAWAASRLTVDRDERAIFSLWVSGDFFDTLGVPALLGRLLTPADDLDGGGPDGPVAMISHRLWQQHFGGAPDIIGRSIVVERLPVTIVGVAPPEFVGVEAGYAFDLFLPVSLNPSIRPSIPYDRHTPWLRMMFRLPPGESVESAMQGLRLAQANIRTTAVPPGTSADEFLREPFALEPVSTGVSGLRGTYGRSLLILLAVVGLLLTVACANLANLFLARGAARREEFNLRRAIGASRAHLVAQLLVESFLLAGMAAVTGLVLAAWMSRALVAEVSGADSPIALQAPLDWRMFLFAVVAATAAALLCGLWPALRVTRVDPADVLREAGRGAAGGRQMWAFDLVLIAQVAVSLLLVVTAGLLVQTARQLARAPLGFEQQRLLTVTVTSPTVPAALRNAHYHRLVDAIAALPDVEHAGGSLDAPLTLRLAGVPITLAAMATDAVAETNAQFIEITPGWLSAYGIPLQDGRDIDGRDISGALPVMLVNDAFVRRFSPDRPVVGRTLEIVAHVPPTGRMAFPARTVVGVVGDAVYASLREPAPPTIYMPLAQREQPLMLSVFFMAVRSMAESPTQLAASVSAAIRAIDPDVRLVIRPASEQVDTLLGPDRLSAVLSAFGGGLALVLALLGMYGVTAYGVSRRRAEIGVRLALGSTPLGVIWLVLSRVVTLASIGTAIGIVVSLWASTLLAPRLYGLEPREPWTLAAAALVMLAAAIAAGWPAARRAARINPIQAMKG